MGEAVLLVQIGRPGLRGNAGSASLIFLGALALGGCANDAPAPTAAPAAGFYRSTVIEPGNGFRSTMLLGPFPEIATCERTFFDFGGAIALPLAAEGRCVDAGALSASARRLAQGAPYHRVVLDGGTSRMTVENPSLSDDERLALCFFLKDYFEGPWRAGSCHAAGAATPAAASPMAPPVLEFRQMLTGMPERAD
jgi:hypothetical protein